MPYSPQPSYAPLRPVHLSSAPLTTNITYMTTMMPRTFVTFTLTCLLGGAFFTTCWTPEQQKDKHTNVSKSASVTGGGRSHQTVGSAFISKSSFCRCVDSRFCSSCRRLINGPALRGDAGVLDAPPGWQVSAWAAEPRGVNDLGRWRRRL